MSPEGLEKTFIDFYNNTFLIETGIINLFHYIRGISCIHNFNDRLEIWWLHQKIHMNLITILGFFERSYAVPDSCKVSYLGPN